MIEKIEIHMNRKIIKQLNNWQDETRTLINVDKTPNVEVDSKLYYISAVTGKEYPATNEGEAKMSAEEAAYWDSQKITKSPKIS